MDRADITLLALAVSIWAVSYIRVRTGAYRDGLRDIFRYRLFKVRDDLIYFVASGKLEESSFIFQFFYGFVTQFLNQHDRLNILQLLRTARSDKFDPVDRKVVSRVKDDLAKVDGDIVDTIEELYSALIDILVWNCSFLRVAQYIATNAVLIIVLSTVKGCMNRYYDAWRAYKSLKDVLDDIRNTFRYA